MTDLPDCNQDVYLYGVSLGYFDMKKGDAEAYCKSQTERTGRLHDWHYAGGRVHIKALDGRSIPADRVLVRRELLARVEESLRSEIEERYAATKDHPAIRPKYLRDIAEADELRTLIDAANA